MKIKKSQLRRIIRETLESNRSLASRDSNMSNEGNLSTEVPDVRPRRKSSFQVKKEKELAAKKQAKEGMYNQGREDSLAKIRPQLSDKDYMMGYNEAQEDAGLPRMQPPSDSGRGKKLDPSKLKGAFAGKYYGSR